jgi:hypothetical protein
MSKEKLPGSKTSSDWSDAVYRAKLIFGASGISFFTTLLGHPLDALKVRMQIQNFGFFAGLMSFFHNNGVSGYKNILSGINGLYKGLVPNIMRRPLTSAYRTHLMFDVPERVAKVTSMVDENGKPTYAANIAAGLIIAGFDSFFVNIIDRSKLYKQTGGNYKSLVVNDKDLASKFKNVFLNGLSLAYGKSAFAWVGFLLVDKIGDDINKKVTGSDNVSVQTILIKSVVDSAIKVAVTNPIDVVKTYAQSAQNINGLTPWKIATKIANEKGYRGFARGAMPRIILGAGNAFIGFAMKEADRRHKADSACRD